MTEETDAQKQSQLNKFLRDLSINAYNEEQLIDKSRILLTVYSGEFRHEYSQILATVYGIRENDAYSVDFLTDNIERMKSSVIGHPDFRTKRKPIIKLYDHVSLEIARLAQQEKVFDKQSDLEKQIQYTSHQYSEAIISLTEMHKEWKAESKKLQSARKRLKKANCKLESTIKETENLKAEVITVIGIFAAIMLAFVGGMSFTSSTLTSIHQSSIYKVAFIANICGFVVFNTIFCLIYIISKITSRDIYAPCNDQGCKQDCKDDTHKGKCWEINRIRKRLPYIFWVNTVILILMVGIVVCWIIDIKTLNTYIQEWLYRGYPR